jgi:hypothetical protein
VRFIQNISIVYFKTGEKIYDLNKSFNIVLRGRLRNNATGFEYNRLTALADFPIQININVI